MGSILDRIIYLLQKEKCRVHGGMGLWGISWIRSLEWKLSPFQNNFQNYLAACSGKLAKFLILGWNHGHSKASLSPIEQSSIAWQELSTLMWCPWEFFRLRINSCRGPVSNDIFTSTWAEMKVTYREEWICLLKTCALMVSYTVWELGGEVKRTLIIFLLNFLIRLLCSMTIFKKLF